MAYNEFLADRVRQAFKEKHVHFSEKNMFGGLCFMVDDRMCCGVHFDKKKNTDLMMARIGAEATPEALARPGCHPMDFTGRPMKGYVFLTPEALDSETDLSHWVQLCVDFNPLAQVSKKRK